MTAASVLDLIDMLAPTHERTSCEDDNLLSVPFQSGKRWHIKCTRCALISFAQEGRIPEGIDTNIFFT